MRGKAIILILFILMIVVVSGFQSSSPANGSSSVVATKGFNIFNETADTLFYLEPIILGNIEESRKLRPGGLQHFELPSTTSTNTARLVYSSINENGNRLGSAFGCTLNNPPLSFFPGIINVSVVGPYNTDTSYGPYPSLDPQLTVTDSTTG